MPSIAFKFTNYYHADRASANFKKYKESQMLSISHSLLLYGRTGPCNNDYTINKWRLTRESAISRIEAKTDAFYTVDKATGKRAYIGVVRKAGKAAYLRTYADGKWNDNLLAQAECGSDCKIV